MVGFREVQFHAKSTPRSAGCFLCGLCRQAGDKNRNFIVNNEPNPFMRGVSFGGGVKSSISLWCLFSPADIVFRTRVCMGDYCHLMIPPEKTRVDQETQPIRSSQQITCLLLFFFSIFFSQPVCVFSLPHSAFMGHVKTVCHYSCHTRNRNALHSMLEKITDSSSAFN